MSMPTPAPELWIDSPYVGPRPFTGEDRDSFFGREAEVDRLVSEVVASPTLVIYAVSGAGKTSLLAAGLRPAMRDEGFDTLPTVRLGGLTPRPDAANVFTNITLQCLAQRDDDTPDGRWRPDRHETLTEAFAAVPPGTDDHGFPQPRLLVFDQFEELFTLNDERWPHRKAFFHQISAALAHEPELRVVFALREEYLAQFGEHAGELPRIRFHLERLRHDAGLQAVTGPIQGTGREFAPGVAERLVNDLQQTRVEVGGGGPPVTVQGEFVEPLHLQVVCHRLWQGLAPDTTSITDDHLDVFGNVDEALTTYYDDAVARAAAAAAGMPQHKLRSALESLFITSSGTRATVFSADAQKSLRAPAITELENLHIVRTEWRAGGAWLELSHDRLIGPIQSSNERVLRARRTRVTRRAVAAAVLTVAALAGLGLSAYVSATNTNSNLQRAVAVAQSAKRVSQRVSRTTTTVAAGWLYDFNKGYDRLAAHLMHSSVWVTAQKLVATRHGRGTWRQSSSRFESALTYLNTHPCLLGGQATGVSTDQTYAYYIVQSAGSRPGYTCRTQAPPVLLTITVRGGKVSRLDSKDLGLGRPPLPGSGAATATTASTATPTTPDHSPNTHQTTTPPGQTSTASAGTQTSSTAPASSSLSTSSPPPSTSATSTASNTTSSSAPPAPGTTTASPTTSVTATSPAPTVSTFTVVTPTSPGGG